MDYWRREINDINIAFDKLCLEFIESDENSDYLTDEEDDDDNPAFIMIKLQDLMIKNLRKLEIDLDGVKIDKKTKIPKLPNLEALEIQSFKHKHLCILDIADTLKFLLIDGDFSIEREQ